MKYLTREELKSLDKKAIAKYGIPALILMENAGKAVADKAEQYLKGIHNLNIAVICGKGNNGGDGFVAARHLHNKGHRVYVIFLDKQKNSKPRTAETATNLLIAKRMGIPIIELPWLLNAGMPENSEKLLKAMGMLYKSNILIDAIFGIGLDRQIDGSLKNFIDVINHLDIPIIAVDIPSGLDTDTGKTLGIAVQATETVTFAYPKAGFRHKSAKKYTGRITVADISIPCKAI